LGVHGCGPRCGAQDATVQISGIECRRRITAIVWSATPSDALAAMWRWCDLRAALCRVALVSLRPPDKLLSVQMPVAGSWWAWSNRSSQARATTTHRSVRILYTVSASRCTSGPHVRSWRSWIVREFRNMLSQARTWSASSTKKRKIENVSWRRPGCSNSFNGAGAGASRAATGLRDRQTGGSGPGRIQGRWSFSYERQRPRSKKPFFTGRCPARRCRLCSVSARRGAPPRVDGPRVVLARSIPSGGVKEFGSAWISRGLTLTALRQTSGCVQEASGCVQPTTIFRVGLGQSARSASRTPPRGEAARRRLARQARNSSSGGSWSLNQCRRARYACCPRRGGSVVDRTRTM